MAARVLQVPDPPGCISRIDVAQAVSLTDRNGADQHLRRRVFRVGHAVVLVEGRDVPGNIRRHAGHETRQAIELVSRVVEARNEERHDLEPDAHTVKRANRLEDWFETSTKLAIVPVIKALEIDFVEIHPRPKVAKHARRGVTVRDKRGHQPARAGLLEDRDRPLARDQRLVVGADDDPRAET